jgi:hypothetical protein
VASGWTRTRWRRSRECPLELNSRVTTVPGSTAATESPREACCAIRTNMMKSSVRSSYSLDDAET